MELDFIITKSFEFESDNYTIKGIASTGNIDRHGDIVESDAFDLKELNARKVPLLLKHNKSARIGLVESFTKQENNIIITGVINKNHPKIEAIKEAIKSGELANLSIGFRGTEVFWRKICDRIIKVFKKIKCTEVSLVRTPANADAVVLSHNIKSQYQNDKLRSIVNKMLVDKYGDEFNVSQEQIKKDFSGTELEILQLDCADDDCCKKELKNDLTLHFSKCNASLKELFNNT